MCVCVIVFLCAWVMCACKNPLNIKFVNITYWKKSSVTEIVLLEADWLPRRYHSSSPTRSLRVTHVLFRRTKTPSNLVQFVSADLSSLEAHSEKKYLCISNLSTLVIYLSTLVIYLSLSNCVIKSRLLK